MNNIVLISSTALLCSCSYSMNIAHTQGQVPDMQLDGSNDISDTSLLLDSVPRPPSSDEWYDQVAE